LKPKTAEKYSFQKLISVAESLRILAYGGRLLPQKNTRTLPYAPFSYSMIPRPVSFICEKRASSGGRRDFGEKAAILTGKQLNI